MTSEFVCEFANVSKQFRGHVVIADLGLQIKRGEMVALVGPSGCGKSTVLNLIGLLEAPDSGKITLFGLPAPRVGSGAARRLLRTRLGYLFQNYALIDSDTVDANLKIAQTYAAIPRGRQAGTRAAVLEQVGLGDTQKRRVYGLSGGEQQRLAVARLLLKPCDLVLADEPTGSLDAGNRDEVLRMLHEMRDNGKTIILVTHDPVVAESCDRSIDLAGQRTLRSISVPAGLAGNTAVQDH